MTGTGFTLYRCAGEAEPFDDPIADAFLIAGKVVMVLGYHYIRGKPYICVEDVNSLAKKDMELEVFRTYYDQELFHEVDGLTVLAYIGKHTPKTD